MILDHGQLTEQELIEMLGQLACLRKELDVLQRRVRRLEKVVEHRKNLTKKLIDDGESWEDITAFIEPVLETYQCTRRYTCELIEEYRQLTQIIFEEPDSRIRMILTERYINGLSWKCVAFAIGDYDEQYPRRLHNRFIAEYVKRHNDKYQI